MNTCKVVTRPDNKKKTGYIPIYLRITIDRKKKDYPLQIETLEELWDSSKCILKKAANHSSEKNNIILKAANKAESILLKYQIKNLKISHQIFEKEYLDKNQNTDARFETIAAKIIEGYVGKYGTESIKHYKAELSKIKKYRANLMLGEMDYQFFIDYEHYMRNTLNNHSNTVHKTIYYLRTILNTAQNLKLIDENPLTKFKIKKEPSEERVFLGIDEVIALEKLLQNQLNEKLKNTLIAFLFACYTSLRYSDIKRLTKENITPEEIKIRQQKTKEFVCVPLSSQAKSILLHCNNDSDYLFKIFTNQKMNEYLKILAMMAGIDKCISFHVARHTFATISLNLGIRMEVVSNLLGHTSLKTTAIYAKLLDKTKHEEMKKWENA